QYTRSDPFNLQQIEVYNGANSVYSGSGSVGGTINLVSKAPQRDNLTILNASVGTDNYYRGTIDSNYRVSDLIAVRLNAMVHRNDVPGRDVENYKRWGVAPAITIGVDSPTNLTLAYFHQHDNNTPIYGVPYFKNEINNGPLAAIDDSDYYGIVNLDKQVTDVDRVTATFKHSFSDHVSIRNQTRYQRVAQYSQTSAPQGTFCLANGLQPVPTFASIVAKSPVGAACSVGISNVAVNGVFRGTANPSTTPNAFTIAVPAGFFQPNGPRGLVRDQLNTLFYNQTDLRIESGAKGEFHNTLVIGGALTWEDYSITSASLVRDSLGQALVLPQINMTNPTTVYTGPVNFTTTAKSKSSTTNKAIYAFDNLELNDMFALNGGLRWENDRASFRAIPLASYPPGTAPLTALAAAVQTSDENLFSWRVGGVFKPIKSVSIYAAFANSKTPSSSTVRTGCGVLTAVGAADPCAVAPEKAKSYEVGIKADVHGVQLTAAAFRNERTNFRVPSNDPLLPTGLQVLDGKSRVDGIALGATGYIVPNWLVFANYTYLNGRVKQSVSKACLAAPSVACLNSNTISGATTTIADPQAGDRLVQTPEHSGSIFTSYK
ncbi:MAG TPA: TonB-dependent receptor, partial [Vicinamibacterales bacterium]